MEPAHCADRPRDRQGAYFCFQSGSIAPSIKISSVNYHKNSYTLKHSALPSAEANFAALFLSVSLR